jgi:hypothetical protein
LSDIFSEYQKLKEELHQKPPTVFDKYEELQRELAEKRQQREHEALDRLENLMESLTQRPPAPVEKVIEEQVPEEIVQATVEELVEEKEVLVEIPKVDVTPKLPVFTGQNRHQLKEAVYDDSRLIRRIENLERRLADIIMSSTNGTDSGGDNNLVIPVTIITDYNSLGYSSKDVILCDTENNDITVTLPDTAKNHGWKVHVKKMHRNHQLYIRGYNSSQLIDEKELVTINTVYTNLIMVTDGSHWYIV